MKRKRYTEEQIIGFLKAHEAGAKLADLVRKASTAGGRNSVAWKSRMRSA